MLRDARAAFGGVAVSLLLHGALALVLLRLPPPVAMVPSPDAYEVELDAIGGGRGGVGSTAAGVERRGAAPLVAGGGTSAQNVDAIDRGERGDAIGASAVVLLLPRDEGLTLQDAPMNAYRTWQAQRIRTDDDRATREDRRATPSPAEAPFLASGAGDHRERRPVASADARTGARDAPTASIEGAARAGAPAIGASASPSGERIAVAASGVAVPSGGSAASERDAVAVAAEPVRAGTDVASPGRGIQHGRGERDAEAARVAHERPPIDQGPAATPSLTRDARVRDDEDAELLAASMIQSMVESTARRGQVSGAGRGGVGGGGAPGSGGGRGEGGRASPYGPGSGDFASLDTNDGRYVRWYLDQRRRVSDALVFPRRRMLSMDQGASVYRLVVRRDGSLAERPMLVRSSGFDDFDRAALAAIEESAPFSPVPRDLAPGLPSIRVTMRIVFSNPMVQ